MRVDEGRSADLTANHDVCITSLRRSSVVQIIELSAVPIASETRLKLLEEIEREATCSFAPHARLHIDSLEGGQRLLHDVSQLIIGERAVLFERDKRAEAQRERRH